ncbi:MAG: hypothetical protein KAG66_19515 [Methylococcales bacterium]|nr:hypothetical protein [Methylococcales bacterium]
MLFRIAALLFYIAVPPAYAGHEGQHQVIFGHLVISFINLLRYALFARRVSNYYLRAALPIKINCAATLTPYIGYSGAPDVFLMDGIQDGGRTAFQDQSDILHGGISLEVRFENFIQA